MHYIAHKTRIHLNNKQAAKCMAWANASRYAYNWALNMCFTLIDSRPDKKLLLRDISDIDKYFNAGKYPLGHIKPTRGEPLRGTGLHEWLRDVPGSICQGVIKDHLKTAWQRCFKKIGGQPNYKKRHSSKSFSISNGDLKLKDITKKHVTLPKKLGTARLGDMPSYFKHVQKLSFTTLSQTAGKWYISFIMAVPEEIYYQVSPHEKKEIVGVDVSVNEYVILSDSENKKCYKDKGKGFASFPFEKIVDIEKRIERLQTTLDRHLIRKGRVVVSGCVNASCRDRPYKNSNEIRYYCSTCRDTIRRKANKEKKLRASIAVLKARQANIRENKHHEISKYLAERYHTIVMEEMDVKRMTKSAKGTKDNPGELVQLHAGFHRDFLNISPYSLRLKTQMKTERWGGQYIGITSEYTSQTCSQCGHVCEANRKTPKVFECISCGYRDNAYYNAARNIEQRGIDKDKDEKES